MTCKTKSITAKKKAFTLIELLIVIAIIGILFIVLISKVNFATDKAKATGVQTDFRSFQVAIETVAKENAGLSTFGWDIGDVNGDRVRNSYDKGDANKNGKQDEGEVFIGSKTYGEEWVNVYTLTNPVDADDMSAIAALEEAINKNLDPKLHITINNDLTITMANGAQDPWKTEYHGYYITNAINDGKDRGAIVIYSNGANQEWGSEHGIANGVVTITVPGNNVYGKDDMSIVSCYSYMNGYGEVLNMTTGFSNNQAFGGGAGSAPSISQPGGGTGGSECTGGSEVVLPSENPFATLNSYTWGEIKALAQENLSAAEYKSKYGIELGQRKDNKYILVDFDNYGGFVFMYNAGVECQFNSEKNNNGGYANASIATNVESLYTNLSDADLKSVIQQVTINCNTGNENNGGMNLNTYSCHMFLPSAQEVGLYLGGYKYANEGSTFEYFTGTAQRSEFSGSAGCWWTRTVISTSTTLACSVLDYDGGHDSNSANDWCDVMPCFVVGTGKTSSTPANKYSFNQGTSITINKETGFTLTVNADMDKFVGLMANGKIVREGMFVVTSGSTIIHLFGESFMEFDANPCMLTAMFEDGIATITLNITSTCSWMDHYDYNYDGYCDTCNVVYCKDSRTCIDSDNDCFCDWCGPDGEVFHYDDNSDGRCDKCGIYSCSYDRNHTDADTNCVCDLCKAVMECQDYEDYDGLCDNCGAVYCRESRICHDLNNDHRCDYCGNKTCVNEDNNCTCDVCGDVMTHYDSDENSYCDKCGAVYCDESWVCVDADGDCYCDWCWSNACVDNDGNCECDNCHDTCHDFEHGNTCSTCNKTICEIEGWECEDYKNEGFCSSCGKPM